MKKILGVLLLAIVPNLAFALDYKKQIGIIRSPDTRPCTLFQLVGVSNADGTNTPWFGVINTHEGYNEILTMLMVAKTTGKEILVTVSGDGSTANGCGHAAVIAIHLP